MMKRVAIPVVKGMLSEYFGECEHYEIFEISENKITGKKIEASAKNDITKLPEWIANKGVSDIIVYKVDNRIISLFSHFRINLFVGIPINTPRNLVLDYMNGVLKSDEKIIAEILGK